MSSSVATSLEAPYLIAASVPGPLHIERGIGCQDRVACRLSDGEIVIAIADGLGSAPLSEIGAEVAVAGAVGLPTANGNSADIARGMAFAARSALENEAESLGVEISDLACTLIVAVALQDRLHVAHIGDGAVVAETANGILFASPPGESEYANEVEHLACDSWEKNLRFADGTSGVRAFALFSDGCQRAALSRNGDGYMPHPAFFRPLFDWARGASDLVSSSDELRKVLAGAKLSEHSEDDKTLALAILRDTAEFGGDGSF